MSEPAERLRLGGMALGNGLLIHGPTRWAAAVRAKDGTIRRASGRKPRIKRAEGIPGVRGVVKLGEAMLVIPLVKRALPQAKLPYENLTSLAAIAGTSAVGMLLRKGVKSPLRRELALGVASIFPALVSLRGGELAQYHGAEHKTIGAYEQSGMSAADVDKEHERCGSHLIAPMLAANVAGTVLLHRLVTEPNPVQSGLVNLASMGVAVEAFVWSEKHADSQLSHAFHRPGFEIQRVIGTQEPTPGQLEVGAAALEEILSAESD